MAIGLHHWFQKQKNPWKLYNPFQPSWLTMFRVPNGYKEIFFSPSYTPPSFFLLPWRVRQAKRASRLIEKMAQCRNSMMLSFSAYIIIFRDFFFTFFFRVLRVGRPLSSLKSLAGRTSHGWRVTFCVCVCVSFACHSLASAAVRWGNKTTQSDSLLLLLLLLECSFHFTRDATQDI